MEDIKYEDRLRRYDFNIDGKIITVEASDRDIEKAVRLLPKFVEALKDAVSDFGFEYNLDSDPEVWKKLILEAESK